MSARSNSSGHIFASAQSIIVQWKSVSELNKNYKGGWWTRRIPTQFIKSSKNNKNLTLTYKRIIK